MSISRVDPAAEAAAVRAWAVRLGADLDCRMGLPAGQRAPAAGADALSVAKSNAPAPPPAPGSAPNLDRCTHNVSSDYGLIPVQSFREAVGQVGGYALVVRDYSRPGVPLVDVQVVSAAAEDDWRRLCGRTGPVEPRERDPDAERSESSVSRSRVQLRRRCLALGADHLLTFTRRGKFGSRDEALAAWAVFERKKAVRWLLRNGFVQVVETHKTGGFHIHIAVRGFVNVSLLRRLWFIALGGRGDERGDDTPGNVHARDRRAVSVRKTASYLSKYLGKDARLVPSGRKLYACSRGLVPRAVHRFYMPFSLDLASDVRRVVDAFRAAYGVDFEPGPPWEGLPVDGFSCWSGGG